MQKVTHVTKCVSRNLHSGSLRLSVIGSWNAGLRKLCMISSSWLLNYSCFVMASNFTHNAPTNMFGVSMDFLCPPNQNVIGGFWVPASEGPEGTQRVLGGKFKIFHFSHKTPQHGCLQTPLELSSPYLTFWADLGPPMPPRVCGERPVGPGGACDY